MVERFDDAAVDLFPLVTALHDDFHDSDAANAVPDLSDMGDLAGQRFRLRYPELTDEAVEAVTWCYTWHHK